jgi:hypothetical protein
VKYKKEMTPVNLPNFCMIPPGTLLYKPNRHE